MPIPSARKTVKNPEDYVEVYCPDCKHRFMCYRYLVKYNCIRCGRSNVSRVIQPEHPKAQ